MKLVELLRITITDMPILAVEDGKVVYDSRTKSKIIDQLIKANESTEEILATLANQLTSLEKYKVMTIETKMHQQLEDELKKEKCIIANVYQL